MDFGVIALRAPQRPNINTPGHTRTPRAHTHAHTQTHTDTHTQTHTDTDTYRHTQTHTDTQCTNANLLLSV